LALYARFGGWQHSGLEHVEAGLQPHKF
jgi:hypothetical protein